MLKIALISDIHFGKFARTKEFAVPGQSVSGETKGEAPLCEGLIEILKEQQVQYIFISGDLTSTASPHEFYYCSKKIASIADRAGVEKDNIIWTVGNHDVDWEITRLSDSYSADDTYYDIIKESYRKIAANAAYFSTDGFCKLAKAGGVPLSGIRETEHFIVFVLNSALYCTHDQEFSHGKISIEQLSWLESAVKQYEDDKRWKIVLMHHHPQNYTYPTPGVDISALEDGSEFMQLVGQYGIDLILHGHRHHPYAVTKIESHWKKPATFICSGSLTVNAEQRSGGEIPNTFHIIELTDTVGILNLFNYEYSSAVGWRPFVSDDKKTPLDAKMMFGKVVDFETKKKKIEELGNFSGKDRILEWQNLDEILRFCRYDDINNLISKILSSRYNICGKFPAIVCLLKKGE